MNREIVIQVAREAIAQRLSADSMIKLQSVATQYGEQQQLVDDVEHWWQELNNTDFDTLSKPETDEWLDKLLRRLP
ncbi:hypothetical protein IQ269_17935 [Tychonema sp. LEGE 07199]|uniref:hypothetical protein n=1 Tax=unclassified Tychonema TaxID=2642144 RepID=UPI00187F08EF|nr:MULTISPECIES: hypothetical protein [unclassified Tychonema]MBE9122628.1 hypothetical protein [Tychonema sp. LEGE 07199]MBE9131515.1 hypothetical protein [Tychonema sp. LEGE 07196]